MTIHDTISGASLIERPNPITYDKNKILCVLKEHTNIHQPDSDNPIKYEFDLIIFDTGKMAYRTLPLLGRTRSVAKDGTIWESTSGSRKYLEDLLKDIYKYPAYGNKIYEFDTMADVELAAAKITLANAEARKLSN